MKRFGRLQVLRQIPGRRMRYECRCSCGRKKILRADDLKSGRIRSCGCLRRELAAKQTTKHGLWGTPEWSAWAAMINRCDCHKNYENVNVCRRWRNNFPAFLEDMGRKPSPQHTLERKDNAKGYVKSNCRWATWVEQRRNTSRTVRLTLRGVTLSMIEWSEKLNIKRRTLKWRRNAGWSDKKILTTPVM